ncbi:TNT domain-containing protein [Streptomyces sp. NPDC127106]|uniref:TNT domain-containing protein n=1 Tax=Streptomyces sp. NPDC127106 TaxID=3345360 RepID=UPI00363CF83A
MAFPRWCASLATTAGLTGSVLLGALPSTAAEAQASTVGRTPVWTASVPPPAPDRASGDEDEKREEGRKEQKEREKGKGKGNGKGEESRPASEAKTGTDAETGDPDAKGGSETGKTGSDTKTESDTKTTSDTQKARCLGLVPSPYPYAHTEFKCNDWRFGPAKLPTTGVLGAILSGYQRFGELTPVEFLHKWWNPTADSGLGAYRYPNSDGFARDANGQIIATEVTLQPGQLLDRFGAEFGSFLAPAGTKYGARSIPPSNLNTQDPRWPFDYHLYRVKQPILVCAGPTLPWFEQPGEGVQYVTTVTPAQGDSYCPNVQTGTRVSTLVANGYLERAN